MRGEASVIHLNGVNFMACVEALREPALRGQVFVVAPARAARARILDVSRQALREGLSPGMRLDEAQARLGRLRVVPPSPGSYATVNKAIEAHCARYAPLLENAGGGHFFLDLQGTRRLFGAYLDTAARIRNEVARDIGLEMATALAPNKLVAKVGTRSLRPEGLVAVREGDEGAFLAHQDLSLLPGIGRSLGRILASVGIGEIGGLAELGDAEVRGLLGPQGRELRDAARGLDRRPVMNGDLGDRRIEASLDFPGDVLEAEVLHGGLIGLVEACGLELRLSRLASRGLEVEVAYVDEVLGRGRFLSRVPLSLDGELLAGAGQALAAALGRRVRIRALRLSLFRLEAGGLQLDLFEPEAVALPGLSPSLARLPETGAWRATRLQEAVDGARRRYGGRALTRCAALVGDALVGQAAAEAGGQA